MTGSIVNQLMGGIENVVPVVGMGATMLGWSDRHAATIVAVKRNKAGLVTQVTVQQDHAKRIDNNGMSESQVYEFSPNPDAYPEDYSLRKNGRWVRVGTSDGSKIAIGFREEYWDPSF